MQHESLSAIRRGPFTLGGVRFLHKFPEESANSRLESSGFAAKVISSLSLWRDSDSLIERNHDFYDAS